MTAYAVTASALSSTSAVDQATAGIAAETDHVWVAPGGQTVLTPADEQQITAAVGNAPGYAGHLRVVVLPASATVKGGTCEVARLIGEAAAPNGDLAVVVGDTACGYYPDFNSRSYKGDLLAKAKDRSLLRPGTEVRSSRPS